MTLIYLIDSLDLRSGIMFEKLDKQMKRFRSWNDTHKHTQCIERNRIVTNRQTDKLDKYTQTNGFCQCAISTNANENGERESARGWRTGALEQHNTHTTKLLLCFDTQALDGKLFGGTANSIKSAHTNTTYHVKVSQVTSSATWNSKSLLNAMCSARNRINVIQIVSRTLFEFRIEYAILARFSLCLAEQNCE